jgi:hypothetical protein
VACQAFKPIYWSGKDTAGTVAAVKEHNAAITSICPDYTKKPKTVQPKSSGTTFKDRWHEGVRVAATVFR